MEDELFIIQKQSAKCFYIYSIVYNLTYNHDFARTVRMGIEAYIEMMKRDFNAFSQGENKELFYKSEADAQRAIDWIEAQLVMYKLSGK